MWELPTFDMCLLLV